MDSGELAVQPIQHREPYRFHCRKMAEDGWLANPDHIRNRLGGDGIGAKCGNQIENDPDDLLLARIGWLSVAYFSQKGHHEFNPKC